MTVVMDNRPDEILSLVRGETYKRSRGDQSLRGDASSCNLKGKWPKNEGEYARLWGKTEKGEWLALPSIKEVVIGIYIHYMKQVEDTYNKDLKENYWD